MTSTSFFKGALVCLAFLLFFTFASPAEGAYPRLLMVYGAPLTRPLVVEDFQDIVRVISGTRVAVDQKDLDRRPYFELALFWGDVWNRYMSEGKPASALKPEDVTPFENIPIRGKLYTACNNLPALMTLTAVNSQKVTEAWQLTLDGVKVLEKLGVPIKSDCK